MDTLNITNGDIVLEFIYLVSALFFVWGLKLLSSPDSARRGNLWAGTGMIMAMTGGGPTGTYNATEVVGLNIYYTAFLSLKFGLATAMAWVLGAMLIGFTMIQLKKLSRMEYRTVETAGKN